MMMIIIIDQFSFDPNDVMWVANDCSRNPRSRDGLRQAVELERTRITSQPKLLAKLRRELALEVWLTRVTTRATTRVTNHMTSHMTTRVTTRATTRATTRVIRVTRVTRACVSVCATLDDSTTK